MSLKSTHRGRRRNRKAKRNTRRSQLRCESLEDRWMLNGDPGDLSFLNDEFDDAGSLQDWQLVSQAEGWNAQAFEIYDIDQTTSGAMTIAPHTSTWYEDYQGDLAYKEVTGDFIVTTEVTISDRDDIGGADADAVPGDSTFSLGGVMLRTPRNITDAANEWTAGGSNFVFLSAGHGYDGSMSLESKTTVDSNSELELIPINSETVQLRVERVGASITTMYRFADEEPWQIAANFDRPDMPETLQVGLLGYTDYEKTATFTPFHANDTTLVDTPENAAASSNPGLEYDPDLQATFDYIRFERPDDGTPPDTTIEVVTELPVVNHSFEDITGESPYNEFTFGALPGWDVYDPLGIASDGDGPSFFVGTLTPGEVPSQPGVIQNFPGGAADGDRVAIAFNYDGTGDTGEYGLQQTLLGVGLEANTTYELEVEIGNIATGIAISGQTFFLDGMPGYRIDFLAGGQVLASDDNSLQGLIAEGEFGTSVVQFAVGDDHPLLGQDLGIRLVSLNETTDVPAGNDLEVDFDNVRLTSTTVETVAMFPEVGDQQVHHADLLVIDLPALAGDGTPISYAVSLPSEEWVALDETYNLEAGGYAADGSPLYYEDYAGLGVKWLQTGDGQWMFLESDGSFHQWQGSVAGSPEVAQLTDAVFADPSLLHDAMAAATASLDGTQLTIDPTEGFFGAFQVALEKSASGESVVELIDVEVTNTAPSIPVIGDQVVGVGETWTLDLPATDTDGDTIQYEVQVLQNVAADLRDSLNITAEQWLVDGDYGFNYLGQQERWVQSAGGWLFITPEGSVHQWNGDYATSPQVAQLDVSYYNDPGLLVNAEHVDVSVQIVGGQLQIHALNGFVGSIVVRLLGSDGVETFEQAFTVDLLG